jgi:hypothetical protein
MDNFVTWHEYCESHKEQKQLYSSQILILAGKTQVPTADMLVSTTLLVVMCTIWIQAQF